MVSISEAHFDSSALALATRSAMRFELLVAQPPAVRSEQRRDDFFSRAVEEGVHDVLQRGLANDPARHHREVDVLRALLFVPDVALGLEDAQLGAHGGIARLAGQRLHQVARRWRGRADRGCP